MEENNEDPKLVTFRGISNLIDDLMRLEKFVKQYTTLSYQDIKSWEEEAWECLELAKQNISEIQNVIKK